MRRVLKEDRPAAVDSAAVAAAMLLAKVLWITSRVPRFSTPPPLPVAWLPATVTPERVSVPPASTRMPPPRSGTTPLDRAGC